MEAFATEALAAEFLENARRMISIDSSPTAGTVEIARFAQKLAESLGLVAELQMETWNGIEQANVIVRPWALAASEAEPPPEFLLETHLDTPDPGAYALWRKTAANPFNASIYPSDAGDVLHGLGVADVKLDFLCKLYALRAWKESLSGQRPTLAPVLVGTYGEELGMAGAVKLLRKKKVRPAAVLVGEPTDRKIVVAGKGFASVEIEIPFSEQERKFRFEHDTSEIASSQSRLFSGRAAHSSAPQDGDSAITKVFDALERMPNGIAIMEIEGGVNHNTIAASASLEIDLAAGLADPMARKLVRIRSAIKKVEAEFPRFPDPQFSPSDPTMNIGMVRTLEDHVKIGGCVRLPPTVSQADYEAWMQVLREACAQEEAVFRIGDYKQPFRVAETSPLLKVCRQVADKMRVGAALDTTQHTQAVANEANVFSKFGYDCLVWGPGQGVGNSHTPNECVRIQDLHEATVFYRRVIEQFCERIR